MMKHMTRLAAVLLAAAGCSASDVGAPASTGTRYILETANGGVAPAIVATWNTGGGTLTDTGTVYLTGDTLTLDADGHYSERAWFEGRSGGLLLGRQSWNDRGDWTRAGDSLHFASERIEYVAFDAFAPSADRLTTTRDLREEGNVDYVFRRR